MPARLIDGKAVADARRARLAVQVHALVARGVAPCLAAVTVTPEQGWGVYQKNQAAACAAAGIAYRPVELPAGSTPEDLAELIEGLNVDPLVHGIILQNPFPAHLDARAAQAQLSPDKDVEGVGPANLGLVLAGRATLAPCTALAAVALAQEALPDLTGVEAVVVGASVIVGRPVAQLLLAANATVRICHIHTRDLAAHTRQADLLVVAVGRAGLITPDHVKPGAVVVDVGINRVPGPDGKLITVGDVAPAVASVASAMTPVPGGVGALTTTILLEATVAAAARLVDARPALDRRALARLLGGADLPPDTVERVATLLARHQVSVPRGAAKSLLERRLGQGVLLLDGGMGTALIARGVAPAATAQANLDHSDLVLAVHREHLTAGAQVLIANTFLANRFRCGNRDAAVRLASSGVQLARQAAAGRALVLGSIGPLGPVVGADLEPARAEEAFGELALAMADAGADGLLIETMGSTAEAVAALAGARRVTDLPVLVCRALDRDDAAEMAEFARAMEAGGAAAIGLNCCLGPRALLPLVQRLVGLTRLPVIARPNAGQPAWQDGQPHYHLRPEWFVAQAKGYLAAGATVLGGCCGVDGTHLHALAVGLRGVVPGPRSALAEPAEMPAPPAFVPRIPKAMALVPGRLAADQAVAALSRLAAAGAEAVGLCGGWPGSPQGARLVAQVRHVQDACGRPGVLELNAAGLTLARAQEKLLTAHLLDLHLVLVDAGVFPAAGAGVEPMRLVQLVAALNTGRDLAGARLSQATAFTIMVRVPVAQAARLGEYRAAGAHAAVLPPIYEPAVFRTAMREAGDAGLPIIAELLLLPDAATADELDNELPSLSVPDRLKQRLVLDPAEDLRGVQRFLAHWRDRLAGVTLLLPDGRTTAAEAVLRSLR